VDSTALVSQLERNYLKKCYLYCMRCCIEWAEKIQLMDRILSSSDEADRGYVASDCD
jgi:hypothetical protein